MTTPRYPLEPGSEELRSLADQALDLVVDTLATLEASPAAGHAATAELLDEALAPPPEAPEDFGALLDLLRRAAAAAYETAGPGYLAYIPGGGVPTSAIAELVAMSLNRYTGKTAPAPALVALEESVLRWLCSLYGFPAGAQGLLTTGGSMSNLIALAAARTRAAEGRVDQATVYVGEHAHGSIAKTARTVGIAREHVRVVRSTPELRMDVEHLRALLAEDRRAGLIPVLVAAASGTTNTGTVDPLAEIAAVCEEAGIWFHVDGAYGGFFQLTERGRQRLAGIERADSVALDPHKALFLPYGTGALVVRSADALRYAFAEAADYLQDIAAADELPDFDHLTPELSRPFRGLRLWLPLHLHGVDAFRQQLDEKLDLTALAFDALSADARFEVPVAPDLSIVAFRLAGRDDEAQKQLLEKINASQRVFLSSTRLGGAFFLRVAILSFRTHEARIRELLEIISRAADEVG